MDYPLALLIAALAIGAATAFAVYRRQQGRRVLAVQQRVRDYLSERYGELPKNVSINCSDDRRWPILVHYSNPQTGGRQDLQFMCTGSMSTFKVVADSLQGGESPSRA